jgi:hypothetical protein
MLYEISNLEQMCNHLLGQAVTMKVEPVALRNFPGKARTESLSLAVRKFTGTENAQFCVFFNCPKSCSSAVILSEITCSRCLLVR